MHLPGNSKYSVHRKHYKEWYTYTIICIHVHMTLSYVHIGGTYQIPLLWITWPRPAPEGVCVKCRVIRDRRGIGNPTYYLHQEKEGTEEKVTKHHWIPIICIQRAYIYIEHMQCIYIVGTFHIYTLYFSAMQCTAISSDAVHYIQWIHIDLLFHCPLF